MASPSIASIFAQRVVVGVGDMAVSNNVQVTLSTYALGSCLGVVAYDPVTRVGGILHLMLPDSSLSPDKAGSQPAMFADTGLPLFFRSMMGMKADRGRLRLCVAGGASVLSGPDSFKIGDRNVIAARGFLTRNGFAVRHSATGGTVNRTLHLEVGTGTVTLKMPEGTNTVSLAT
jgi:chemotaxis protein CheD